MRVKATGRTREQVEAAKAAELREKERQAALSRLVELDRASIRALRATVIALVDGREPVEADILALRAAEAGAEDERSRV